MESKNDKICLSKKVKMKRFRFRSRRSFKWVCGGVLIFLAVAIVVMMGGESQEVLVVATEKVSRGDLERVLTATGIIKPEDGAEVKTGTRVTGVIETLHVKLGDYVVKGQTIALMDKREQEAEGRKLEAELGILKTDVLLLEKTYPLKIRAAAADLSKAMAEVEHAEISYDRIVQLIKTKSAAKADLEKVHKERITAHQNAVMRKMAMQRLEAEYSLEKVRLDFAINRAEAALESTRIRLSHATIVSPIDGVVSDITAQAGETVVAGLQVADLITVLDVSRLELHVYVDEHDIGEVKVGDTVRFNVGSYPDRQFSGTVALIHPGPEIRNNIVYYLALVRLMPETARALRPEMTAHCELIVDNKENILLLPNSAFKWVGSQRILLAIDEFGTPAPRDVRIGMVGIKYSEVIEGLQENDVVVTKVEFPDSLPAEWEVAQ